MESFTLQDEVRCILHLNRELLGEVKMLREIVQRQASENDELVANAENQRALDAETQRDAEAARRVRAILGSG